MKTLHKLLAGVVRLALVVTVAGVYVWATACGAAAPVKPKPPEAKGARPAAAAKGAPEKVYTNADLERLFGPPETAAEPAAPPAGSTVPAPPGAEPPPAPPSALDQLLNERANADSAQQNREVGLDRIAELRQKIDTLERQLLAIRNPLLARPAPPEGAETEWAQADNVERQRLTEAALAQARQELEQAEAGGTKAP